MTTAGVGAAPNWVPNTTTAIGEEALIAAWPVLP